MRCIHDASNVVDEVGVGQPSSGRLQDKGGLVAVEQGGIEPLEVIRPHTERRRKVAHDLVRDQDPHEWRPATQQDHDTLIARRNGAGRCGVGLLAIAHNCNYTHMTGGFGFT